MPWEGNSFVYTEGTIECFLENFLNLREQAICNPECQGACGYYDMLRAMAGISMKPGQFEAFLLRLSGYSYREMGDILGVTHMTAKRRMSRALDHIREFLCE